MLNAKININGSEVLLTGDKEDIVYALKNATAASIPNIATIMQKAADKPNNEKKLSKYSKEDMIKMYDYLDKQGDYQIKQFEITRGGKADPVQYIVCLVFDQAKQRYINYNPKTEDRFLNTFTIKEVIEKIKLSEPGFNLLHTVANRIMEKMEVVNGLEKIANKPNPFDDVMFPNYSFTPHATTNNNKEIFKDWISKNIKVGKTFVSENINKGVRKSHAVSRTVSRNTLNKLATEGIIKSMKAPGGVKSKTWKRIV
jgi:hypothetical protein